MSLSIRWRLTLWNSLALSVVVLGFGAVVYGLLSRALHQRIDRMLLTEYQELIHDRRLATDSDGRLRYWIDEFKEHENVHSVVYDARGAPIIRTTELAADSVPPFPGFSADPVYADGAVPILGRQRLLIGPVPTGGETGTIVLMASLAEAERELGLLLTVLATAAPLALLVGGGLAYFLARKALAPMERLHHLTEQVTASRLDQRLPVVNAGDELGKLTRTVNAMIARLETSFAEIRRFTADASHELRTPLTAIRMEAEVALQGTLNPDECRELLGSILEECERLTRLTDQLLTLAREDGGMVQLARAPVDLAAVAAAVGAMMEPAAQAKGLRLEINTPAPAWVLGDDGRLRQVVLNLLDNAIKYTSVGGIHVQVTRSGDKVICAVRDSGSGIPAEQLGRVFERFFRVDKARSRELGGTGLGLSIVQSIVQAHDGTVELTSVPGQGTTATVTLSAES